jgi:two-component system, response regulator YesN
MKSLMIVDDEVLTVKVIAAHYDWTALDVGEIFMANSMRQACELFELHRIDIMICDIEMPQGNGLELLAWMREHHLNTVTIFLTGHADFQYCKKAIELSSINYVLKPIDFSKLQVVIESALKLVDEQIKANEYKSLGEKWIDNSQKMVKQFWLEVLAETIVPSRGEIVRTAQRRNIPFDVEKKYILVLIKSRQDFLRMKDWEKASLEFALNNMASELISGFVTSVITFDTKRLIYVVSPEDAANMQYGQMEKQCKLLVNEVNKYLEVDLTCFIGEYDFVEMLSKQLRELELFERSNVACCNDVLFLGRDEKTVAKYIRPDMNTWAVLLKESKGNDLYRMAQDYFCTMAENKNIDAGTLKYVQQDFMQMVYSVLESRGVPINWIFEEDEWTAIFTEATESVACMLDFISYVIRRVIAQSESEKQPQTVVGKVCSFISKNIYSRLSRNEIAEDVDLNPEYLSKLFKKETGVSLVEYIQNEKMEIARKLLIDTRLSISEIASNLGYYNFAYFSQLFRKFSGNTPGKYRKISLSSHK